MKITFFSDLHLELLRNETRVYGGWEQHVDKEIMGAFAHDREIRRRAMIDRAVGLGPGLSRDVGIDLVILAGDIGRAIEDAGWPASLDYAESVHRWLGCPVLLVPGNHEFYGLEYNAARAALMSHRPGVQVLHGRSVTIGDLRVLGHPAWTDYQLHGNPTAAMAAAESGLNDHRAIQIRRGPGEIDRWRARDALAEHHEFRAWLSRQLALPHDGPTIVVTHHVPHPAAGHPAHRGNRLEPAFVSDLTDLIRMARDAGALAWIFGHNHWCCDVAVEGLRLVSAQVGYHREWTGWRDPGILEVDA